MRAHTGTSSESQQPETGQYATWLKVYISRSCSAVQEIAFGTDLEDNPINMSYFEIFQSRSKISKM
jgi:hypothetical protein